MERRINTGTPVADHVMTLLDAAKISYSVVQACELQLFDEVHKSTGSGITAAMLAKHKSWEPDALRRLMDAMVAVKLLSKSQHDNGEDSYQNTEGGRLLMKDGPPALHEYATSIHETVTSIRQLADTIKKGPSETAAGTEGCGSSGDSFPPEFWIDMYKMCDGVAQPHADQIVTAIDLSKHKKAVDLGGGSGVYSYALLRAYPEMEVILGELPSSLPVIEEHFISKNKNPRLSTRAGVCSGQMLCVVPHLATWGQDCIPTLRRSQELGEMLDRNNLVDYNTDTLPQADLYLLANVVSNHDADRCKELLTKVHAALHTGGGILIVDLLVNDLRDGPPLALAWDLAFPGKARMYTGKEIAAILNECNFGDVQIVKTQEYCNSDIIYCFKK